VYILKCADGKFIRKILSSAHYCLCL